MSEHTYYDVLKLPPRAAGAAVNQAYWQLARKYQLEAETDPRARAQLDVLNEAYAVLGTPRLREEYDARLGAGGSSERAARHKSAGPGLGTRLQGILGRRGGHPLRDEQHAIVTVAAKDEPERTAAGRPATAAELRSSTAAMVARWRNTTGTPAGGPAPAVGAGDDARPDTTLVDIFRSEQALEEPGEPLSAVIDVLRGSKAPV